MVAGAFAHESRRPVPDTEDGITACLGVHSCCRTVYLGLTMLGERVSQLIHLEYPARVPTTQPLDSGVPP